MSNYFDVYYKPKGVETELQKQFSKMVEDFKIQTKDLLKSCLGDLEAQILPLLFDDTMINLRNACMKALADDSNRDLRDMVWKDHEREIIDENWKALEAERDMWRKNYEDLVNRR